MTKIKLGSLIDTVGDGIHGTPKYDDKGTYYFINGNNIVNGKVQISKSTPKVSKEEYERIKRPLNNRTLLLSINGTLGNVGEYNGENIALGKSVCYINVKNEEDKQFVKYILKTKEFQKYILLVAHGSIIKNLAPSQVAEYEFEIPNRLDKKNICNILKLLDEKINNNNNINTKLESILKVIFDYWFLQFEFPNNKGKPYKSSGGEMVYNEELQREIPKGWQVKELDNLINISNEKMKSGEIGDRLYIPIEVIPRKKISFSETADADKASTGLCPFDEKTILLSNRRVYFHKVSISPFKGVTRDTVILIQPKIKKNLAYVFQLVNSDHFIKYATLNSHGTEQPVLSPITVKKYKVLYPNNNLDLKYSDLVNDLINKILINEKQNRELKFTSEFLLPLLLTGKIKLTDN